MTPPSPETGSASADAVEAALRIGRVQLDRDGWNPAASGFWRAVAAVKANPTLVERYAERIAAVDRDAFLASVLVAVRAGVGTAFMSAAAVLGVVLVAAAGDLSTPWDVIGFGAGGALLLVATHGLAHLIAGRLVGIRFTHWFISRLGRPQPGVKTDYQTYLRASPRARAWMHAAGALTTKAVPFLLLPPAAWANLPSWVTPTLAVVGVAQIATDALWSVRASDWKKFRRELAYLRPDPNPQEHAE